MTNFDNKKTPRPAEENDIELTLDNLDGVSGGAEEPSTQQKDQRIIYTNEPNAPSDPTPIPEDKNGLDLIINSIKDKRMR